MHSSTFVLLLAGLCAFVRSAPVPLANTSCPPNNEYNMIVCIDETHWSQCNWGKPVPMGLTAAGTVCRGGAIVLESTGETLVPAAPAPSTPVAVAPTVSAPISTTPASMTPTSTTTELSTTIVDPTSLSTTTLLVTTTSQSVVLVTLTRASSTSPLISATVTSLSTSVVMVTVTTHSSTAQAISTPEVVTTPLITSSTPQPTTTHTTFVGITLITTVTGPSPSSPASTSSSEPAPSSGISNITPDQITAIAPSSSSCDGAPEAGECATASDAAPFVNAAFDSFGITTTGEKAALLSLMAFESAEFKYNINHFPGNPGQGTRNMMMFPFILEYVQSIPSLAASVPAGTTSSSSADVMNQVRALALDGAHTFATAAWFYNTKCTADVKTGVQSGSLAGWTSYITDCVGTTVTSERQAYWTTAMSAL